MKNKVYIKKSGIKNAGRGVYASVDIKKGEVIEVCPILIFSDKDDKLIMKTRLQNYVYEYTKNCTLFALGYGSLYNHLNDPNAKYELLEHEGMPEGNSELYFTAIKPIKKNEEIFINYGISYDEKYKPRR